MASLAMLATYRGPRKPLGFWGGFRSSFVVGFASAVAARSFLALLAETGAPAKTFLGRRLP